MGRISSIFNVLLDRRWRGIYVKEGEKRRGKTNHSAGEGRSWLTFDVVLLDTCRKGKGTFLPPLERERWKRCSPCRHKKCGGSVIAL